VGEIVGFSYLGLVVCSYIVIVYCYKNNTDRSERLVFNGYIGIPCYQGVENGLYYGFYGFYGGFVHAFDIVIVEVLHVIEQRMVVTGHGSWLLFVGRRKSKH